MTFHDPTQRECMMCGRTAPTGALTYHQNIGIIAMHIRKATPMQVCRSCVHEEYWKRFAAIPEALPPPAQQAVLPSRHLPPPV